jgi:hypothetical protein
LLRPSQSQLKTTHCSKFKVRCCKASSYESPEVSKFSHSLVFSCSLWWPFSGVNTTRRQWGGGLGGGLRLPQAHRDRGWLTRARCCWTGVFPKKLWKKCVELGGCSANFKANFVTFKIFFLYLKVSFDISSIHVLCVLTHSNCQRTTLNICPFFAGVSLCGATRSVLL